MTLEEAFQQQPEWVQIWLNVLLVGAFILPLALLIWRQTRLTAVLCVAAGLAGGLTIDWMYGQLGYVKLLGLPHLIVWTPLAIWLVKQIRREDMPVWPRRAMVVILATIAISLAFDYTDVARYLLGERTPTILPPQT